MTTATLPAPAPVPAPPRLAAATARIAVEGMTCGACAARVQRKLERHDGVGGAAVDLASHRATVTYDPGTLDVAALVAAVDGLGYRATALPDAPALPAAGRGDRRDAAADLRLRLAVAVPLALAIVVLTWTLPAEPLARWTVALLAVPVQFWAGAPFLRGAWTRARARSVNMDTLVALGTLTAFAYSTVALVAGPGGHTHAPAAGGLGGHLHYDMAAAIIAFLLAGRWCEARARSEAGRALRELAALAAPQARLLDPDRPDAPERLVPAERLAVGDLLLVRPGDRIATDGAVVAGASDVDESALTGESLPVAKLPGSTVTGATLNHGGLLRVRATAVGADTAFARLVALVERAQASRPQVQRLADRVAAVFVPVVIALATATAAAWAIAGEAEQGLLAGVAVLVVACPCALGLATPIALMVGSGRGAQLGILIEGAEILERSSRIDAALLDKTGTITTGDLRVTALHAAPGVGADEALRLAAAAEAGSEHPIGRAVVAAAAARGIPAVLPRSFRALPGEGVVAAVAGREVRVGSLAALARAGAGAAPDGLTEAAAELEREGGTVVGVALDGRPIAVLGLGDRVRPEASSAVEGLARMGIDVAVLSGDGAGATRAAAGQIGVTRVLASRSPADKLAEVERLQALGHRVAMVGDGVNDAAALARADLGIAMGAGTAVAIEAADITVLRPDLRDVVRALRLARETYAVILQNLGWAFGYNLVALPLAASGLLSPALAGLAMGLSSVAVVLNSLRLRRFGAPGRPTKVRSRRRLRVGVAAAWLLPTLVLGAAAALPAWAGGSASTVALAQPGGQELTVTVDAGDGTVHAYLTARDGGEAALRDLRLVAAAGGEREAARLFRAGPAHFTGTIADASGTLRVRGTDGLGRPVTGRVALRLP